MIDSGMVKVLNIPEHTGNTREFSEIETDEYLTYKAEGDQAARGRIGQGYTNTMTSYRVAENIGVTYEMRTQNKYMEVYNSLFAGGRKGYNRIDLDLSHRIGFGASTAYTDRDGRSISIDVGDDYALFYSLHSLSESSTTFRNILANNPRLSKGAIESMERLVTEETYNHFGEKMTIDFDVLWTTDDPNTVNTAREYLQSSGDPESAHEGVTNVYKNKYRHAILPRVATTAAGARDTDKRYYWGIASTTNSSFYLGMWESPHLIPPKAGANSEDVQTDDWDFRNRAGYGITIVGASWIKMSKGDGSA